MKKLLYLFALTFCFISCSEDENPDTQEEEQNNEEALLIEGGTIATFQLVNLELENVTLDNYAGVINGTSINLVKSENNTLSFLVDDNFTVGESILDIVDLNTKVRYTVNETVLQNSVTETIESLASNFNNYIAEIGTTNNTPQEIHVINTVNNFNEALAQMSAEDRAVIANTYQANKTLFDTFNDIDYTIPQTRNVLADYSDLSFKSLVINWGGATIGAGIATWTAVASASLPLVALPLAVIATVLWQISHDLWSEGFQRANVVYEEFAWDDIISNPSGRNMGNGIEFDNGITRSIDFDINSRGVSNNDSGSTNTSISSFFNTLSEFNDVIVNLNGIITIVNTVPFVDFGLIDTVALGNASQETLNADQDIFNNLSLSINNSNLTLGNVTFNNGNINITISIIDETIVNEFVDSEINYTYEDDTNSFTGSFPVRVNKEDQLDIVGTWQMVDNGINCQNSSSWGNSTIAFHPNGTLTWNNVAIYGTYILSGEELQFQFNNSFTFEYDCTDGSTLVSDYLMESEFNGIFDGTNFNGSFSHIATYTPNLINCQGDSNENCQGPMTLTQ